MTKKQTKTNLDVNTSSESSSKYKRVKLSAESICVIKKALISFNTKELEVERVTALSQLCNDDFFLVLYTYKKREHSRTHKTKEQTKEQQMHFNTIAESLADSARIEKERTLKQL
jgi:hypothetical protein